MGCSCSASVSQSPAHASDHGSPSTSNAAAQPESVVSESPELLAQLLGNTLEKPVDFDEEARKFIAGINESQNVMTKSSYHEVDELWQHPSGARFLVGNQHVAKSLEALQRHGITHIVNCTSSLPNYHEYSGSSVTYFSFDIERHREFIVPCGIAEAAAVAFVSDMLSFVDAALVAGQSVMAHCLAGAHRAGTTGIICLMYFLHLKASEATRLAKQRRPAIDPIGDFPMLLELLDKGFEQHNSPRMP